MRFPLPLGEGQGEGSAQHFKLHPQRMLINADLGRGPLDAVAIGDGLVRGRLAKLPELFIRPRHLIRSLFGTHQKIPVRRITRRRHAHRLPSDNFTRQARDRRIGR